MVIFYLIVLGLSLGSFVNALVYRLHEQGKTKTRKRPVKGASELSILRGRSMCVHCKQELAWQDLIPVFSWITLKGKCRYCHKAISWQYPAVELATALLFLVSYLYWPLESGSTWTTESMLTFGFWLVYLTGFVALAVYDLRWHLLPNRIVYPLLWLAGIQVILIAVLGKSSTGITDALLGAAIGGGIFYVLFQVSRGEWIGGGDVKLGFLLGLVLGNPICATLMIFLASLLGSLAAIPLLIRGKVSRRSHIPFGPFLIAATIIARLFGPQIISWYRGFLLPIA